MKKNLLVSVVSCAIVIMLIGNFKLSAQDITVITDVNYITNPMPTVEQCILTPVKVGGVQTDEFYLPVGWDYYIQPADSFAMWTMTALQWGWPNFGPHSLLGKDQQGVMYQRITGLPNGQYLFRVPANGNYLGIDLDLGFYCYTDNKSDSTYTELVADDLPGYTNRDCPIMNVKNGKCTVGFYAKNYGGNGGADIYDPKLYQVITTGVKSMLAENTSAWVSKSQLKVQFSDGFIDGVDIFNLTGQLIFSSKEIKSNSFNTYLKEKGLLFVKVNTSKGSITKKVVNQ